MDDQKKEVSDLKFSDFQSAGIRFDHTQDNTLTAMGIGEEEYQDMKKAMMEAVAGTQSISEGIDKTINADVPMKWKIIGLLKLGETRAAMNSIDAISKIPDNAPGAVVKAMAMLTILNGGRS
jgi:hypothetical protein